MEVMKFIKKELQGWGKYERILFPLELIVIVVLSFIMKDSKIALVSALCGISYTILSGKGKISCYFFGVIGTLCYVYISMKNALYGNAALYMFYYFPMEIIGFLKWRKHLDEKTSTIVKTVLSKKAKIVYLVASVFCSIVLALVLKLCGGATPYLDSITCVLSIVGFLLVVNRCFEQWYVWFIVNLLSSIMWINAYLNGSNCLATVIMWVTYVILSLYFMYTWKRDLARQ